jgi:hypothetical protein
MPQDDSTIFLWLTIAALLVVLERLSRPLSVEQEEALASRRRLNELGRRYCWSRQESSVSREFKSRMRKDGAFHKIHEPMRSAPSLGAALLKGKKHEWIVFLFVSDGKARLIYFNKGPDNMQVWPLLETWELLRTAERYEAEAILCIHNHPGGPLWPSDQDFVSGRQLALECLERNIAFFDFVCVAGKFYEFLAAVPDAMLPVEGFLREVQHLNRRGRWQSLRLRMELALGPRYEERRFAAPESLREAHSTRAASPSC